jgi:hypothetical protein
VSEQLTPSDSVEPIQADIVNWPTQRLAARSPRGTPIFLKNDNGQAWLRLFLKRFIKVHFWPKLGLDFYRTLYEETFAGV